MLNLRVSPVDTGLSFSPSTLFAAQPFAVPEGVDLDRVVILDDRTAPVPYYSRDRLGVMRSADGMPQTHPGSIAILTGCRRAEIVGLRWQAVNFFQREFRVTGKGDLSRTIPMTEAVYALLWGLKDHHKTAVFTFEAQRNREGRKKGKRYPITVNGLQTAWNRHVRPHVEDFRFHDTRHTAATRLVCKTGNIRLAQKLLGHGDVATTSRYAHVTHDDLRAGMEAAQ